MAITIDPIPSNVEIVDRSGLITAFFRLLWEKVRNLGQQVPAIGSLSYAAQTAAISTVAVYTTRASGIYRLSCYLRKTIADGVSSSLTATFGWTDHGTPLTEPQAALTTDTISANQSTRKEFYVDANTDITIAIAYASNTPNKMTYNAELRVEQIV